LLFGQKWGKGIIYDRIQNLFSKQGIEFFETGKGLKMKLDRLIEIDEKLPYNQC
jgi:hypothetical protein